MQTIHVLIIFILVFANSGMLRDVNTEGMTRNIKKTFCPHWKNWPERERKLQCELQGKIYTCLMDDSFQPRERCIFDEFIENGTDGCPFITIRECCPDEAIVAHSQSFHACPEDNLGCPPTYHGGYFLSKIYKYPACVNGHIQSLNTTENTPSETNASTYFNRSTGSRSHDTGTEHRDMLFVIPVLLFAFICLAYITVVVVYTCNNRVKRRQKSSAANEGLIANGGRCTVDRATIETEGLMANDGQCTEDITTIEIEGLKAADGRCTRDTSTTETERLMANNERCREDIATIATALDSAILRPLGSGNPYQMKKAHKYICNKLEGYLNSCQYSKFDALLLKYNNNDNVDLRCHLNFLTVHSYLYQGQYDKVKKKIDRMMNLCNQSSNPYFFEVKLLSAKARLYVNTRENEELYNTLYDIDQKVSLNKTLFDGRSIGWVLFNRSRYLKEEIRRKLREIKADELGKYILEAVQTLEKSMGYFSDDNPSETKRCKGILILEIIALELKWFGKDIESNTLIPGKEDINKCNSLLKEFDYLDIPMDTEMKVQVLKTMIILCFREERNVRMKEYINEFSTLVELNNRHGMLEVLNVMKDVFKMYFCFNE